MSANIRTHDFTKGRIAWPMVLFALPLVGSSLVQQLYNTVDLLFVGNVLGTEAAAAVGAGSLITSCLVGFFIGLSTGAGIMVSHAYGRKDIADMQATVHTSVAFGIAGGIAVSAVGWLATPALLQLLGTPDSVMTPATAYLRLYLMGAVPIIVYNMTTALLRAVGNSRSPLLFQLAGGLCNVALDALFLIVLHLGVEGTALAGVISQSVAALLALNALRHCRSGLRLHARSLRLHPATLKTMLRIGIPVGMQTMAITLSNVVVQFFINGLGAPAMAAYAAYFKIELVVYLPIMAFGQAMTTFTAQNMGAGSEERLRRGLRVTLALSCVFAALTSTLVIVAGPSAFLLFVDDGQVAQLGSIVTSTTMPFYALYAVLETIGALIRGAGRSTASMAIVVGNICIVRTLLVIAVCSTSYDVQSVAIVYPITWASTCACMLAYYRFGKWSGMRDLKATDCP